jgi:uncharacterized membrane protein YphA (DoxX/SURF4 family)
VSGLLRHPRTHLLLRLLLGAFFVFASLDKIASPAAFAKIVYQWQVIGPVPSNLVAVTLPWIEIVAGLLLIAGVWKRESALVIALMLVVFIVAAGSVMARGIDVENCGCVSLAKAGAPTAWPPAWMKGVGWFLVTRNLVLLAAALVLVLVTPVRPDSSARLPGPVTGPGPVTVTVTVTGTDRQRTASLSGFTPASGAGG